jgi:ornithine cyclodeaminase/alanine dehydrogenase-like protein (mu-crystallin family)
MKLKYSFARMLSVWGLAAGVALTGGSMGCGKLSSTIKKATSAKDSTDIFGAFLGTGAIAAAMATSACLVHKFKEAYCYGLDFKETEAFCAEMTKICKFKFTAVKTAEEATRKSDVIFTQTPASAHVLQLSWLKEKVTIIASGSDQPTKNEIPSDVMKNSKFITDLTRQCVRVGELRTAVKDKVMKEEDVYAELGEVINGSKKGRTDKDGIILVDLTGTGAQDAAIGSYAMEVMSKVK